MKLFLYNLLQSYVHGGQRKEKKLLHREQLAHASILDTQRTTAPMVLELACGSGNLAGEFPPERYAGIDIDAERIENAKKNYPDHKFLLCGTNDESFKELLKEHDFIFCNGLLHHLSDQQCRTLLVNIGQFAPKPTTFVIMEPVMPQIWKNPIGFVLANLDNGHNMKSIAGYLNLFKEPPLQMEPLSFWPRWPVSGFAFVLRFN
jgi:trans-aconitate methyltransferase